MLGVGSVLVDFDGTACLHDVTEHLLMRFGDPSWPTYDEAAERGEMTLRQMIAGQDALVHADRDTMLAHALAHCPMDPTFGPFVRWLARHEVPVTLVSDGFGFYIGPLLEAAGVGGVTVLTNRQRWGPAGRPDGLDFVHAHPDCVGCGTCKMQAVVRARDERGPVAFVGEGRTDRFGALYADIVFAKEALPEICIADGVPFLRWRDFDDVREAIGSGIPLPGAVAPDRCPGWTPRA